jgi:hypothetical protein
MRNNLVKWSMLLVVFTTANITFAAKTTTKTYQLSDLRRVVSNHENCKPLYHDLQNLAAHPVVLHFSNDSQTNFTVLDEQGKQAHHTYKILKQDVKNNMVNRIGMGSFELDGKKVEYVIDIAADLNKKDFKYAYPMILSSENAHCYYTALLTPSKETAKAFQQHIQSGAAQKGSDLTEE